MPGVLADCTGPDRDAYDMLHRFPFGYRELIPYYEWVEATLPVQTAAMGTKEEIFFRGCERVGLPVNTTKDILRDSFRPVGAWDGKAGRVVGAELKNVLSDVDRLVNVLVLTDDDVEPDNRVERSIFPPDEHGPIPG